VSHERYSFYNPKHHPYFDQEGGRVIYFEGTYSHTFSGSEETATPRYDYNQILYRLDLSDVRLCLPEPIYEVRTGRDAREYVWGKRIRAENKQDQIAGIAFWAVHPERVFDGLVPVYAVRTQEGRIRLSRESDGGQGTVLFYAYPPDEKRVDRTLVPLFEYRHKESNLFCYSAEGLREAGWEKNTEPVCLVWKNPAAAWTADWEAEPSDSR
jgi:hypothetical protein